MSGEVNLGGTLDKNSFLKLMVTEMTNQNPLQPQDSNQFLNQLAQFTTMEQMMNMEQTQTALLQVNQLSFEHSLIGQTVSAKDASGNEVTGQVAGIQLNQGTPELVINGTAYTLDSLTSMGEPSSAKSSKVGT